MRVPRWPIALIVPLLVVAAAPTSRAASRSVNGVAIQGPCAATGASSYDPATSRFECIGQAVWTGSWNGTSTFRAKGTIGLLSGDTSGTVFHRIVDPLGQWTIDLVGTVTIDGATGEEVVHLRIRRATGTMAGSTGSISWTATAVLSGAPTFGVYEGHTDQP